MARISWRFSQGPESERIRAKVFGVGSAGCNIVDRAPLSTVAVSSSAADIARSHAARKLLVNAESLVGLSDAGPEKILYLGSVIGHELIDVFNNTDVAFIACGLGGQTGSQGAKVLASIATAKGALCVSVVATPFSVESIQRRKTTEQTLRSIAGACALCIEFDNDKLSSLAPNLPLSRAFGILNGIMLRPAMDMCSAMARDDLRPIREVVGSASHGRFGLGLGRGDERIQRAVDEAMSSPWFDYPLEEAEGAIVIYSAADPWDKEMDKILDQVTSRIPAANIASGMYSDPGLADRIRVSVVLCRGYVAGA